MLDTRLFPPDFRGKYPHMFPRDIAVWERFLDKYGELYEGFYYDVIFGKEVKMHPNWEDPYRKDAYILSKLRIDAVGEKSDGIDIIEVKPRGTMGSMGQLLTYKDTYTAEWHPQRPVRMVLVVAEIDPNIISLTEKQGILYIVV